MVSSSMPSPKYPCEQRRAITSVVLPDASFLPNTEHRDLLLWGLRLATGEAGWTQHFCCLEIEQHYVVLVKAREFKRWLAQHDCRFETHKGGSGHLTVIRGDRRSQLPMHGSNKELGSGLVRKIKRDLGLD
jgi:mRNA interferase HicA